MNLKILKVGTYLSTLKSLNFYFLEEILLFKIFSTDNFKNCSKFFWFWIKKHRLFQMILELIEV